MTQHLESAHKPSSDFWLRVLTKSISCIGIFSLLGSNLVLAQEAAIDQLVPTNSQNVQPQRGSVAIANSSSISSQARWRILRQKLHSKQVKPIARPLVVQQTNITALKPQTTTRRKVGVILAAGFPRRTPTRGSTTGGTPKGDSLNFSRERLVKTNRNSAFDYNGAHIDPTEYKIGATTGYEPPKSVILSERLTGCKAVAAAKLSGSICNPAISRSVRIARLGYRAGSKFNRNKFIAKSGIRPIKVGPISIGASGFRVATNSHKRSVLSYYPSFQPTQGTGSSIKGLMFPLTVPAPITSLFGWRIHPITGDQRFHAGTDLGAPLGTPVLAASQGSVEVADYLGGYGLTVVLNHNKSTQQTLYGHLSEVLVEPGEWVEQGTVIGRVGSTGNSTGPHLHFETRQLTPEGWVAADPGAQLESAFANLVKALETAQAHQRGARG